MKTPMVDLSTLNAEQKEAVTHGEGPLLIIAGAGTGKTTVVTRRIQHLIVDSGISPSEVLALTFTEKAAQEMEERVDQALPYGYTQMWIATFHAFCDRILRDEGIHIGLNPGFQLTTEAEAILFLRKNLYQFDLDYFRPLGNPTKFIQGMLQHFSRLKDEDITPEQYLQFAATYHSRQESDPLESKKLNELSHAFSLYETLKAKEGIMDFSDLIANVLKLFRERPNILAHYQKKFKYVLVDEFQDTNFSQNELAMLLAGAKQNITVVGDDDQAIYRWRGAALANIIQFREHYPTAKIVTLTKNYRSSAAILNASYKMIQHNNPDRLEVKEHINKRLEAMRELSGEPVNFLFGARVEQEAEQVVQAIQELVKKKKYTYKDFAILVRANDHAHPFSRALERTHIPYQFLGPGHLFHQDEIKDLIAYMKVLYNFEDSSSLYRVLCMPLFQLPARDVAALLNFAKRKNVSLFEAMESIEDTFLSEETKKQVSTLISMIHKHLKAVAHESAGQVLYYFFEDSGLLKQLLTADSPLSEKQAQNIAKFFEKLKSFEAEHEDASLFAVVDWIELSMQLGESPMAADTDWGETNAVNILTVHSSKGLEFPVVFVVNLVTQRFPSRDRKEQIPLPEELVKEALPENDANLSEERRLFYVAMTRARDYLFLTAANYYGEGKRERKLSPFLAEVFGEEYLQSKMKKHRSEIQAQQLSLIDMLQNQGETGLLEAEKRSQNQAVSSLYPVNFLSYSQIYTFNQCPLHYKLKYILKIPSFPTSAQSFGISVHLVLKEYYDLVMKGSQPSLDEVDHLLEKYWINEGYESKSHRDYAYLQAQQMLTKYLSKNGTHLPLATEIPFQFALSGLKIGGRIDRVDQLPDGRIEIIDYKTGSNHLDEKKLVTDLQMTLYALAATLVNDPLFHKTPEEIVLSLLYLDTDTKISTTRTKEQLEEAKEQLQLKAEEISRSDFACSGTFCKTCEYVMLCQSLTS